MKACLLANGPSLANVDFGRVALPVIGMNRSWKVRVDTVAHVTLERWHYDQNPGWHEDMAAMGKLYVAGSGWPCGEVLKFAQGTFSRDVFKDGVVTELNGVGSVFYACLQVAYTLGYRTVYALGLDLGGGVHFDGSPASPNVERQNAMFAHVPADLTIFVAGSPESRAIFEKRDLSEVYE